MASVQVVKVVAPVVALGVTWFARKALETTYSKTTGRDAPHPTDPEVPIVRAIGWALATASIVAVTNVMVDRWVGRHEALAEIEG
jgi:hypothetical protein